MSSVEIPLKKSRLCKRRLGEEEEERSFLFKPKATH